MGGPGGGGVGQRCDGDHLQPLLLGVESGFDRRGVQAAMRKHDHAVARLEREALQKVTNVSFLALQPKQLPRAPGADHVVPHETRIVERKEAHEAPVARKHIHYRNHRMPATEKVGSLARRNGRGKQLSGLFEPWALAFVNCAQSSADLLIVFFCRHAFTPYSNRFPARLAARLRASRHPRPTSSSRSSQLSPQWAASSAAPGTGCVPA